MSSYMVLHVQNVPETKISAAHRLSWASSDMLCLASVGQVPVLWFCERIAISYAVGSQLTLVQR